MTFPKCTCSALSLASQRALLPASVSKLFSIIALSFAVGIASAAELPDRSGLWEGALGAGPLIPSAPADEDAESQRVVIEEWEQLLGRLTMRIGRPNRRAPAGTYSATLLLNVDSTNLSLRGRGVLSEDGSIEGIWAAGGRNGREAAIRLEPTDGEDGMFQGQLELDGRTYLVFALRNDIHPRNNPLDAADIGNHTLFVLEVTQMSPPGLGTLRIMPNGVVRIAATKSDGVRFGGAVRILRQGDHLLIPYWLPMGRNDYIAGWLLQDLAASDWDWEGPVDGSGIAEFSTRAIASRYTAPDRSQPPLPWTEGSWFLDFPNEQNALLMGFGDARFVPPNRILLSIDASTVLPPQDIILNLQPNTGVVRGPVAFWDNNSLIFGAVNQKSGEILGRIQPSGRGGGGVTPALFDIGPKQN